MVSFAGGDTTLKKRAHDSTSWIRHGNCHIIFFNQCTIQKYMAAKDFIQLLALYDFLKVFTFFLT